MQAGGWSVNSGMYTDQGAQPTPVLPELELQSREDPWDLLARQSSHTGQLQIK